MKRITILLLLLLQMPLWLGAQALFVVDTVPETTPESAVIYIAGDFNGWNPADSNYRLQQGAGGSWSVLLPPFQEGTTIEYKFTLGSWDKVEKGPSGEEIDNRRFVFGNGDTLHHRIYNWSNGSGGESTAAANVHIVSDSFYMPQLDRYRRIWIYLPPDYDRSEESYPVVYLHDGQNLFDEQTSFAGEWEVDETLNYLAEQGKKVPLVVGIDNGGDRRIEELTPWPNVQYGGGKGDRYAEFIVATLKPYIDAHYRTLPDRKHTAVGGSSLGGLMSHYMALKYQNIFGKALVFSPSFWFSDSVWLFTRTHPKEHPLKMDMMCGGEEGESMVSGMNAMKDSLLTNGFLSNELKTEVIQGGHHNEALWRSRFGTGYLWLFDDYINGIKSPIRRQRRAHIFPNPVHRVLHITRPEPGENDTLVVTDINGKVVLEQSNLTGKEIKLCGLTPGVYFLEIRTEEAVYQSHFVKN